jgi:hypothetical protein
MCISCIYSSKLIIPLISINSIQEFPDIKNPSHPIAARDRTTDEREIPTLDAKQKGPVGLNGEASESFANQLAHISYKYF